MLYPWCESDIYGRLLRVKAGFGLLPWSRASAP